MIVQACAVGMSLPYTVYTWDLQENLLYDSCNCSDQTYFIHLSHFLPTTNTVKGKNPQKNFLPETTKSSVIQSLNF